MQLQPTWKPVAMVCWPLTKVYQLLVTSSAINWAGVTICRSLKLRQLNEIHTGLPAHFTGLHNSCVTHRFTVHIAREILLICPNSDRSRWWSVVAKQPLNVAFIWTVTWFPWQLSMFIPPAIVSLLRTRPRNPSPSILSVCDKISIAPSVFNPMRRKSFASKCCQFGQCFGNICTRNSTKKFGC